MCVFDIFNQTSQFVVLRVDVGALINTGKKSGLPILVVFDRQSAGTHRDESRQVLIFAAEPVQHPGTHARPCLD